MKIIVNVLFVVAIALFAVSCNKNDVTSLEKAKSDVELRAQQLGFENVLVYQTKVSELCVAGDHSNCDILNDDTHQPCAYAEHSGTKHDGTHHNGTNHGKHDGSGHTHGSHSNEGCTGDNQNNSHHK